MKKEILVAISVAGVLFGLSVFSCRARKTKVWRNAVKWH